MSDSILETIEAGAKKLFGEIAEEVTEQLAGDVIQAGVLALQSGGGLAGVIAAVQKVVVEKGIQIAIESIKTAFDHLTDDEPEVAEVQPITVADQ